MNTYSLLLFLFSLLLIVTSYGCITLSRQLNDLREKYERIGAYARDIAEAMHEDHYRQMAPDWQVAHDPMEILSQIDNMSIWIKS